MNNLFLNINNKEKEKLLKLLESYSRDYKKNTYVSINNRENIIGYIINGTLEIIKTDYNGNSKILDNLTDNDLFLSYLYNDEYSIITKEDTKILYIDYETVINLNINNNYYNIFLKNLLNIFNLLIKEKNKHIEILSKKSIRDKLLEYFNINSNHSKIIYLPYSYTFLADYLSVDRTAMTRELKNLKDEGFITTKGKKITLLY